MAKNPAAKSSVFIVHGRSRLEREVATVVASAGLIPIILEDELNAGTVIIEKFEREAKRAAVAVVILTGDDVGRLATDEGEPKPRARQNVIVELGYFVGTLGRPKVFVLYQSGVELPSDFGGLVYTELDPEGRWKKRLIAELRGAGLVRTPPKQAKAELVTATQNLLRHATRLIEILQGADGNADDERYFFGEDVSRAELAAQLVGIAGSKKLVKLSDDLVGFVRSEIDPIRSVDADKLDRALWEGRLARLHTLIDSLDQHPGR